MAILGKIKVIVGAPWALAGLNSDGKVVVKTFNDNLDVIKSASSPG